jgi:hypothetical protein
MCRVGNFGYRPLLLIWVVEGGIKLRDRSITSVMSGLLQIYLWTKPFSRSG